MRALPSQFEKESKSTFTEFVEINRGMKLAVQIRALQSPPENISALSPSKAGLLKP
jgi:hypothetical protein